MHLDDLPQPDSIWEAHMKRALKRPLGNQNGQMILEYILLTVVAIGISVMISSSLKENELLGSLISSPWTSLSGMIQNGSWGDPKSTIPNHPNHHTNSASLVGEKAK